MIRRLVWFGLGVGATVWATARVRRYLRAATPRALGTRARESATGISESVREFTADVRAAMAEREAELRDALGRAE